LGRISEGPEGDLSQRAPLLPKTLAGSRATVKIGFVALLRVVASPPQGGDSTYENSPEI